MIKEININGVASFKNEVTFFPKQISFFYGSNGTGKTTISRYLQNPSSFQSCSFKTDGTDIENLVYNKDFVDINFNNYSTIRGIFTLGKDSNDIVKQLNDNETEINNNDGERKKSLQALEKIDKEIEECQKSFFAQCWTYKNELYEMFRNCFQGYVGNKETFANLCKSLKHSSEKTCSIETLKSDYEILYLKDIKPISIISVNTDINLKEIKGLEFLSEKIAGRSGLQISNLIGKINNSDWVKTGLEFTKQTDGLCPFCQQTIPEDTLSMLNQLFDESYNEIVNAIKGAKEQYYQNASLILSEVDRVVDAYGNFTDVEVLREKKKSFELLISKNIQIIDKKIESPSLVFVLDDSDPFLADINNQISEILGQVSANNDKANNLESEKTKLKNKVFDLLFDRTNKIVGEYLKKSNGLDKGRKAIGDTVSGFDTKIENIKKESAKLRSSMSGISNTIEEMNKILSSFGFDDFSFRMNDESSYKVVRKDGSSVGNSLSEGEQRFISFLYFFQLVKGTLDKSGIKGDRLIVIDDPISSLDSNILFIVSTLVKKIIDDCLHGLNGIKQVFILTHNVYFLKEVTYRSRKAKPQFTNNNTLYFLVGKKDSASFVQTFEENPISTTYELLWSEIRENNQQKTKGTIFNTMRRILEYYFNILGGLDYEKLISKFDGEDKCLCQSLLSCVNDSSHFIPDDYNIVITDELIGKYTIVFKRIFELSGQQSHYDMMMKINNNDQ